MGHVRAEPATRSQQFRGTGQVGGVRVSGPGSAGRMGYSGVGLTQQVVSRPVQLDQIHAGKALSTG